MKQPLDGPDNHPATSEILVRMQPRQRRRLEWIASSARGSSRRAFFFGTGTHCLEASLKFCRLLDVRSEISVMNPDELVHFRGKYEDGCGCMELIVYNRSFHDMFDCTLNVMDLFHGRARVSNERGDFEEVIVGRYHDELGRVLYDRLHVLHHPNIISTVGMICINGLRYVAYKPFDTFLENYFQIHSRSFFEVYGYKLIGFSEIGKNIIRNITSGIYYLHTCGYSHGCLTTPNIFICIGEEVLAKLGNIRDDVDFRQDWCQLARLLRHLTHPIKDRNRFEIDDLCNKLETLQDPNDSTIFDHPFMWTSERRIKFMNQLKVSMKDAYVKNYIDAHREDIMGGDKWTHMVDQRLFQAMTSIEKAHYNDSLSSLIVFAGNSCRHFKEFSRELQDDLGGSAFALERHFRFLFPNLMVELNNLNIL